jgi:hypothetical protein
MSVSVTKDMGLSSQGPPTTRGRGVIEFEGLLGLVMLGFWLWALLDCIVSPRDEVRNLPKLVWLLVIFLLWVIGAAAWAFLGRTPRARRQGRRSTEQQGARRPMRADDLPATPAAADAGAMTDARSAELDRRIAEWEAKQALGGETHGDGHAGSEPGAGADEEKWS